MAVMMIMEAPGATTDEYDRTNDIMGIRGDEDAPDGLIQHVAASDGDKLTIIDVWESEESLGRFYETRLGPALEQSGVAGAAGEPRRLPVHNMLRGVGTDARVAIIIEVPDLDTDAYDEMASSMESHSGDGSNGPWVTHTATRMDGGGVLVVDLWDSPESFGAFAEREIGPAAEKVGMGRIEPRIVPVHNVIRGRARVS
jgi:heme-degrading monooxygenase HmoA